MTLVIAIVAGCTPDKALDFGPTGEITTPPEDQLSRDIMRDFAGQDFILANNDHEAHVSLTGWKPGRAHHDAVLAGRQSALPGVSAPDRRASICDEPIDAGAPAGATTST